MMRPPSRVRERRRPRACREPCCSQRSRHALSFRPDLQFLERRLHDGANPRSVFVRRHLKRRCDRVGYETGVPFSLLVAIEVSIFHPIGWILENGSDAFELTALLSLIVALRGSFTGYFIALWDVCHVSRRSFTGFICFTVRTRNPTSVLLFPNLVAESGEGGETPLVRAALAFSGR